MAAGKMVGFVEHLRRLLLRDSDNSTDAQLLERFIASREESSLERLIVRHGPMVWGVCRRILHNHHDAEDAFQATFLVLCRKAASIQPRYMLGNWLHGVALRTARNGRALAARRQAREKSLPELPESAVAPDSVVEIRAAIDDEVNRLPANYRAVIVACELEGRTRSEAAKQLGVPEGTVASRLARAKTMLAKRLLRAGVALPATAALALLNESAWSGTLPASLTASTLQAGLAFAAGRSLQICGVSAETMSLVHGGLTMTATKKLALAAVMLFSVAVLGTGAYDAAAPADSTSQQVGARNSGDAGSNAAAAAGQAKPAKFDDPAPDEKEAEQALADLPGLDFNDYHVDPFLRAAVALQAMGKDKACKKMLKLSGDPKRGNGVVVLCRMLFKKKADGEFRVPMLGEPHFLGKTTITDWPLLPIDVVDGVPFLIAHGYSLEGRAEGAHYYLQYCCMKECDWNDFRFKLVSPEAKEAALKKLLKSRQLGRAEEEDAKFLANQIKPVQGVDTDSTSAVSRWERTYRKFYGGRIPRDRLRIGSSFVDVNFLSVSRTDSSGKIEWSANLNNPVYSRGQGHELFGDEHRVIACHYPSGELTAYAADTGKVLWRKEGEFAVSRPWFMVDRDLVLEAKHWTLEAKIWTAPDVVRVTGRDIETGNVRFAVDVPCQGSLGEIDLVALGDLFVVWNHRGSTRSPAVLIDRKGQIRLKLPNGTIDLAAKGSDWICLTTNELLPVNSHGKTLWTQTLGNEQHKSSSDKDRILKEVYGYGSVAGQIAVLENGDVLACSYAIDTDSGQRLIRLDSQTGKPRWQITCKGLGVKEKNFTFGEQVASMRVGADRVWVTSEVFGGYAVNVMFDWFRTTIDLETGREIRREVGRFESVVGKSVAQAVAKLGMQAMEWTIFDEPPGVARGVHGRTDDGRTVSLWISRPDGVFRENRDWTFQQIAEAKVVAVEEK